MSDRRSEWIHESIDQIEPAAGTRERMLENIRCKAEKQAAETAQESKQKKKVLLFSKAVRWAMPIAACFVITIVGVFVMPNIINQPTVGATDNVEIANPFVPIENAEAFQRQLGIAIDAPAGAKDINYSILDGNMADIYFILDGHAYSLRASAQSGDFSGLNGIEAKTEQLDSEKNAVLTVIRSGDDLFTKITWTDGKVNYVLSNTDGASEAEVKAVFGNIR